MSQRMEQMQEKVIKSNNNTKEIKINNNNGKSISKFLPQCFWFPHPLVLHQLAFLWCLFPKLIISQTWTQTSKYRKYINWTLIIRQHAWSAAGSRPTADISEVRPPTQSNMGNLANHPSILAVLSNREFCCVIATPCRGVQHDQNFSN